MNEKQQKPDMVYGVPCTCGNIAMVATRDSETNKSTYACACGRRYIRDDMTGNVVGPFAEGTAGITTAYIIVLPAEMEKHYEERSAATGKDFPALLLEDLEFCFAQWKRSEGRYKARGF
jgi:hypothetical protein